MSLQNMFILLFDNKVAIYHSFLQKKRLQKKENGFITFQPITQVDGLL